STDRHATYAVLQLTGADDAARHTSYKAIQAELTPASLASSGVTARVGGTVPMEAAINSEVTANIAKAELFSMPVLLILLLVIFGSLAAAALPVAIGGIAILGSFAVLRLLTMVTTVSVYSVNITTILGLGLGIDYGLFMVTRVPGGAAAAADRRASRGAHGGHRGPDRRGLRHHRRAGADQPDAVP